jgi:hypothetical protein
MTRRGPVAPLRADVDQNNYKANGLRTAGG